MMPKMLLCGLVALLAGCMGGEEINSGGTREGVRPGFYEEKTNASFRGVFVDLVTQVQFNEGGAYQLSGFLGTLEFAQAKGRWSHAGNQLFYTQVLRRIANDDGTWGPWESRPDNYDQVRNITETSYQYYYDFEAAFTAEERAQISGISSGWRTFNRIGD